MASSNPVLNERVFEHSNTQETMTVQGTVNKTFLMLIILVISSAYVWGNFFAGESIDHFIWIGVLGGFGVAVVTGFMPHLARITGIIYAVLKGLMVGGLSAFFEAQYPGIVVQAITATFVVFFTMLLLYKLQLIRATEKFRSIVLVATIGIALLYLVNLVMVMFGTSITLIHDSSAFGIGFSVFVVIIAALNLILDFDYIEYGERNGADKRMEWYGAFGLMVTIIWLYIEILRLLAKSRR